MKNKILAIAFILFFFTPSAFAGLYSTNYNSNSSVIAAVEIEGKGIYNLVVSLQFVNKPFDEREYSSDSYEDLINRLSVEWRGIALKKILEKNKYKMSELITLEGSIESEVNKLIQNAKQKYGVSNNLEVVFSINSFYLVTPKDN